MRERSPGRPVSKFLIDTNVWMDYFLARTPGHQAVSKFLRLSIDSDSVAVYVASLSLKDLSYLLANDMKSNARKMGRAITPDVVAVAREMAWTCVRKVIDFAIVAPVGQPELLQAFTYKGVHDDYEDDILLGVAYRIGADYIVTYDKELAERSPIRCLCPREALELVTNGAIPC